jgi:TP901 family phage tail tape measure protein
MADLLARFRLVDEMSAALDRMARSGQEMSDRLEQAGRSAGSVFDNISGRLEGTEEIFQHCEQAAQGLSIAIDEVADTQAELSSAMDKASQTAEELAENEKVSAKAKEQLAQASQEAETAFNELTEAQERAQRAMDEYDRVLTSGTDNLEELEQAAQNAADAATDLEAANERATRATQELADATDEAADEAENGSERGQSAAEQLSNALVSAGIAAMLKEMAAAFLDASNAAAEFQVGVMKISTIADTTSVSISTIQGDIMALSMETGDSVNELSEATYSAISASVDTADAVAFTGTATKLAAGGFTSSATAVDVLTTALNAYGLEANKAESIADMLITTQNLGKTTVDELSASVGKVIPLASAYGVEMDNLSAAYAELTKGGIATAEAGTYLKSMLNELGDSGSTVSAILIEQTGSSFGQLMEQGYSLGDVMAVLGESVNGDAGAFNELWSSSEAGIGALSLYNAGAAQFNTTLNAMQNSVGATAAAYDIMNNTTADAAEDLSNAAANLQISIGQQINPLIDKLYAGGTNILNFITEFTQKHPIVTKAIAAIGIGLGVAATAMVAYTFATTTAIPAIVSFGVTLNAALGPIGWVAIGITALVAAGAAFIAMMDNMDDETAGMTATTREQYYELKDLNSEYERACEQYGEISEEASRLKYQVNDLSAAFEANRQTVEEFTAEVDALCESAHSVSEEFNSAMSSVQAQEIGSLALIQKYADLAEKANKTAAEEQALIAVTKELSSHYPDLADKLDNAAVSTEDYVEALKKACEQEAQEQRQQQAQDTYVQALQKRAELTEELEKAQANYNAELAAYDMVWDEAMGTYSNGSYTSDSLWASWTTDIEEYSGAVDELLAAQAENEATIAEIEQSWNDLADAQADVAAQEAEIARQTEEVNSAINNTIEEINRLTEAYNAAYEAALESIGGQYALWDEADKVVATSVGNINTNLQGQIEYWGNYNANLESLRERAADIEGLQGVIASFADGSADSVNAIAGMAAASDEDLAKMVESYQTLQQAQEETAASIAEMKTDFSNQMDELQANLEQDIEAMDLGEEASAAGKSTIQGFIDGAENLLPQVEAAYSRIAQAAVNALGGSTPTVSVTAATVPGHAYGTIDAENAFIAGEDGPELIIGAAHSTVFPTAETDRIINAVSDSYDNRATNYYLSDAEGSGTDSKDTEQTKRISLEIGGGAPIQIEGGSGMGEEQVVELLIANILPVLTSVLRTEIFEEGDRAYEY